MDNVVRSKPQVYFKRKLVDKNRVNCKDNSYSFRVNLQRSLSWYLPIIF